MTFRIKYFGKKKEKSRLIKLYSTGCHKCKELKSILDGLGVQYEEITDVKQMISLGFTMVPMLDIGKEILDYDKAIEWTENIKQERKENENK